MKKSSVLWRIRLPDGLCVSGKGSPGMAATLKEQQLAESLSATLTLLLRGQISHALT